MTKQRTLRESSRLSKRYKFKRTLATQPSIVSQFRDRDWRINRIIPVKEVLIWEPMDLPSYTPGTPTDEVVVDRPPGVRIGRDNTNWPFRIEFIEQLLEVDQVWVVVAKEKRSEGSCAGANGAIPHNVGNVGLDIVYIEKPKIMINCEGRYRRPMLDEQEMYDLEKGIRTTMVYGPETVWIEGKPNQSIDMNLCNILPQSLTMYNCSFYHRDVAHLYLDSLAEHIKRHISRGEWQS